MFPDGGSCACGAGVGVWGGGAGSHPGPADLWGLLDGKNSGGIRGVQSLWGAEIKCQVFLILVF